MDGSWLKNVSIFSDITGKELDRIVQTVLMRKFRKGEKIIMENEEAGKEFYIIKKGQVKITRCLPDGGEIVLVILGAGDFFGEMSLLDGLARTANATAIEPVEAAAIKKEIFLNILHQYPQTSFNLLKVLSGRLRSSDIKIHPITITNAVGRLAAFLLSLCDYSGKRKEHGLALVNVPPLKTIAETLSIKKNDISRALKDFTRCGYIKRRGKTLIIADYLTFKKMFT